MAWQLAQQALTKIAYPAIHETLVSSVKAYLSMIQLQMHRYVLPPDVVTLLNTSHPHDDGDVMAASALSLPSSTLETQWQTIATHVGLLHHHSRLYVGYLEACHQLYVGLQKRKAPVVYLQDEVEHVMKDILQRLVPFSQAYEVLMTRARAVEATWNQRAMDLATAEQPQSLESTLPSSTAVDSLAPIDSQGQPAPPLTLQPPPSLSTAVDEATYPSTVSSLDLSVSNLIEGVTPRRDSSGPTPLPTAATGPAASSSALLLYSVATLPTIPKVQYEADWETKDLLAAVVAVVTVPKATTTATGQPTSTGNKRGRPSQQSLNHDGTQDGPPPSKQARRSSSVSSSAPLSTSIDPTAVTTTAVTTSSTGLSSGGSHGSSSNKVQSMSGLGLLTDSADDGYAFGAMAATHEGDAMDEEIML